jgi:nucleotide-binding universal stress UspA family protein
MAPFQNIVVPTDFGDAAQRAADLACELATQFQARLTLLHVWSVPVPAYAQRVTVPFEEMRAGVEKALEIEASRLRPRFAAIRSLAIHGQPWSAIVEAVEEHGFDLVVMGTHGRRGVERFFLGSVADRVVRASAAPVLTVR